MCDWLESVKGAMESYRGEGHARKADTDRSDWRFKMAIRDDNGIVVGGGKRFRRQTKSRELRRSTISTHDVRSKDGTSIAYTRTGQGPGLIVLPGNNRMSHNYEKIATLLRTDFTVYVVERRGRGASGPQGPRYSVECEIEDLQAVITATGAANVFGHSYGGFVALQAARTDRRIEKLIAYEPGVSVNGSFDLSWIARFEQAFNAHKPLRASAIFLKESKLSSVSSWPKPFISLLAFLLLRGKSGKEMLDLMPNTVGEVREVQRADSDGSEYGAIQADTMLLGGRKGARALIEVLPLLTEIIPHAGYAVLPRLSHNGPDLGPYEAIVAAVKSHIGQNR